MQEFKHIMFYEDGHKYINMNTNEPYLSVTQSIEKVKPDVDWDYWAVYKHLESQGEVKAWYDKRMIKFNGQWVHYSQHLKGGKEKRKEWAAKADKGKERGTFGHLYLENLFNNKVIKAPLKYKLEGAMKFYQDHRHLVPVYAEQIVGDDEYMIAGQMDRPFKLASNKLAIYDYKFDEEVKMENSYSNLKPPFDFLPDCNFSKYCIQVNMYTWIVEKNTAWEVEYMKIAHITDDNYTLYDVPRLPAQLLADEVRRTHKQPETRA